MASRKRPQRGTTPPRKPKAKRPAVPPEAVALDPSEQERAERDPEHPLSFLPEHRRAAAASQRVAEQLTALLNVLLEALGYSDRASRTLYAAMLNILQPLAIARETPSLTVAPQPASVAWRALERAAIEATKILEPGAPLIAPSIDYDFEDKNYNLIGVKFAFLDAVAEALKNRVLPREQDEDGRLPFRLLDQEFAREELPNDDTTRRASDVAMAILGPLVSTTRFNNLLARATIPNNLPQDIRRLTCAVGLLMEGGNATTRQVARAVLYAFGADVEELRNMFTKGILKAWKSFRKGHLKELKSWRDADGSAWRDAAQETSPAEQEKASPNRVGKRPSDGGRRDMPRRKRRSSTGKMR